MSQEWPWSFAVRPAQLEEQLAALLASGYRARTLAEALKSPVGQKTLVVTFDDAYVSVLTRGLPILSELDIPGTIFVCTDLADGGRIMSKNLGEWAATPFERELKTMSWEELRQLAALGWEVGSHTRIHPRLPELDDRSLALELRGSREKCQAELGQPCISLAYPYGAYDRRVIMHGASAGYSTAVTCFPGYLRDPPRFEQPRVCISRHHDLRRFRLKVAPATRQFRASAAGELLVRAAYQRRAGDAPRRPVQR